MTKKMEVPEPPEAVKNGGGGSLEIWKAIYENRAHVIGEIAGIKSEIRVLGAVVLLLAAAVIGGQVL